MNEQEKEAIRRINQVAAEFAKAATAMGGSVSD